LIRDDSAADPESAAIDAEKLEELQAVIKQLSTREQRVMMYRLKLAEPKNGCSFRDELSREFQVTPERVRQIELQAIKKLKQIAHRRRLRDLLS
jgi:RNA polymerase primary sigma factor